MDDHVVIRSNSAISNTPPVNGRGTPLVAGKLTGLP
jgi:hypothetical protein